MLGCSIRELTSTEAGFSSRSNPYHLACITKGITLRDTEVSPVRIFDVTQNFHKIDYFNAHGTTVSR